MEAKIWRAACNDTVAVIGARSCGICCHAFWYAKICTVVVWMGWLLCTPFGRLTNRDRNRQWASVGRRAPGQAVASAPTPSDSPMINSWSSWSAQQDLALLLHYSLAVVAEQMWATVSFMDFGCLLGGRILPSVFMCSIMCQSKCPATRGWLLSGLVTRVLMRKGARRVQCPDKER